MYKINLLKNDQKAPTFTIIKSKNDAPSAFDNLPLSVLPTPLLKPRITKRISVSAQGDEFAQFLEKDKIGSFQNVFSNIDNHDFVPAVTCYKAIVIYLQIFKKS